MPKRFPSAAVVIGNFSAVPYIHIQLECAKRHYPGVPVIVSDDASPEAGQLYSLCREYGAILMSGKARQRVPGVGDMVAYINGLEWSKANGIQLLVKISRRFIPTSDMIGSIQDCAFEKQGVTFNSYCDHFKFGFRTECLGMAVNEWHAEVSKIKELCAKPGGVFVEGELHNIARKLAKVHNVPGDIAGMNGADSYSYWPFLTRSRMEKTPNYLWHDCNSWKDYEGLGIKFGLTYEPKLYQDCNGGKGRI